MENVKYVREEETSMNDGGVTYERRILTYRSTPTRNQIIASVRQEMVHISEETTFAAHLSPEALYFLIHFVLRNIFNSLFAFKAIKPEVVNVVNDDYSYYILTFPVLFNFKKFFF